MVVIHALSLLFVCQVPEPQVLYGDQADGVHDGDLLRPAQMGNLQRVVASLESTLDVYRIALGELTLVGELLADLGEEAGAKPSRVIPNNAREVFDRLARVLSSRVPADALAPIPRGYHYEALDALEKLAAAQTVAEVRVPLGALVRAVERLAGVADAVVDLFSRQRPIQVQIFDADTALAQIQDTIDQVGVAERRILELREREAELGELYQAYLFLEISLGNMLDVIAAAEEAGINVGFELQLALEGFRVSLAQVKRHRESLSAIVERMNAPPAVYPSSGLAWILDEPSGDSTVSLELSRRGRGRFAGWRVEGLPRERVAPRCAPEGVTSAADRDSVEESPEERGKEAAESESVPIAFLPLSEQGSESGYRFPAPDALEGDWMLRVTAITAFGAPSEALEVELRRVPRVPEPPAFLRAELSPVGPFDDEFYYELDRVRLSFEPSPNDLTPELAQRVESVPKVVAYRIFRGEEPVVTLEPGTTEWIDRAEPQWLEAGARYRLMAVMDDGQELITPECPRLDRVQANREQQLILATTGSEFLKRPSAIEREVEERLKSDAVRRAQLMEELAAGGERDALLGRWWNGVSRRQRLGWLDRWVELQGGTDTAWFAAMPKLVERDRDWVIAALWLEEQEDFVREEVERLWTLVHPDARAEIERDWLAKRSSAWRNTLEARLRASKEIVRAELLEPVRIAHWVRAKDPQERAILYRWWEALGEDGRERAFYGWLEDRAPELVRELRWPANEALTEDELEARLKTAYLTLPPGLESRFLAWWRFERLEGEELRRAIAADVGALNVMRSRLRYAARPFDRATGFNALVIYIAMLIVLPVALLLWRGRRRRVRRIVAPPEGAGD